MITAGIGVLMMPWNLLADPNGYIFTWLIGYSGLLGPIAGIMIADYFVLRRKHLELVDLYREEGIYRYRNGFSGAALGAFGLAVLPNLPGFLSQVGWLDDVPAIFRMIYPQAWFSGFGLAFGLYLLFRKISPVPIRH
jgi:NCS1 family nucleobase:cation symporter-1